MTVAYDTMLDVLMKRMSVRKFKPDPLPAGAIEKILEAGRWAMSGANGQPWEYIVVTDPAQKQALFDHYREQNDDFNFWMEQMRLPELRHPGFWHKGDPEEQLREHKEKPGFAVAPALIAVLGDGRRQWTTVMGGHTFGRHQSHLTDALANTCTLMHLAAASLGLGSQWVTIHIEEGFKRILNMPDVLTLHSIIPVGYSDVPPKKGSRRPLLEIVHYNEYDRSKHASNKEIVEYVRSMRQKTLAKYVRTAGAKRRAS